ncbi:primosomal protein N' [Cylindrospermopsis raciborskii]|uniref:primosomal protein N' n=1 Tax=Cylindrospermopsis raciborskii TaxID=77022 RepID=UPI0038D226A3
MYIQESRALTLFSLVAAEPKETYKTTTNPYPWIEVLVDLPKISQPARNKNPQNKLSPHTLEENQIVTDTILEQDILNEGGEPEELIKEETDYQDLLIYQIPENLNINPGDILTVPWGTQQLGAIAIRLLSQLPPGIPLEKVREVKDVVSKEFFPRTYWELLGRIATYYYTPLIKVIRVALPPGILERSQSRLRLKSENIPPGGEEFLRSQAAREILKILQSQPDGDYSFQYLKRQVRGFDRGKKQLLDRNWVESYFKLTQSKPHTQLAVTLVDPGRELNLTKRQREILNLLADHGGELWLTACVEVCKTTPPTLRLLERLGCVVIEERERLRREQGPKMGKDQAKTLTPDQSQALQAIIAAKGFNKILLHGVTGSGKTEVYLQAIAPLLREGKSALVLVPEIGLTPQLTDRFRARFGDKVQVYHSNLSRGERYDTWRQMFTGSSQVVIGTRSAIFSPLPKLGIIILDEEHDSSFKQDSRIPTYHARTVAQWRAELENCPLILGSATPSLETWVDVTSPPSPTHHQYLSLPQRINSRPLPPIEIVDMRQELKQGNRSMFSRTLEQALQELKGKGQQGILFIHRRGHSTFVSCRSCGYVLECPNCDVSLAYHHLEAGGPELLKCHYCNYGRSHPKLCPECGSPYLKFFGSGTQKIVQELNRQFPDLQVIRFDSDTTRNKGSHRKLLDQFAKGEADLLVGTQMLTKGLDLPQVTLVGVVAADGLLHLSDYRASERAFQTLTQVAGRAGRGEESGRVIIQTYTPEHAVIAAVQNHDYQSFCRAELTQREALSYPPCGRLILLRLTSLDPIQVQNTAQLIATTFIEQPGLDILGPAPASILRVANRYRWQILLKFTPHILPQIPDWGQIFQLCPPGVSLTIDVDPLNII